MKDESAALRPAQHPREKNGGDARPLGDARLLVVLPALNEETAIGSVLDEVPASELAQLGYPTAVWVVDGHSSDRTHEIAREKGAAIFTQHGTGKGNAMRQAFAHLLGPDASGADRTGARYVVMLDSDGSYSPRFLMDFVAALESGHDIVLGSRFRGRIEQGALTDLNRLGNRLLNRLARLLYGVPVSDVCTGMWGFSVDSLRRLGLAAEGFDLEADIFASACLGGARVAEIPIAYRPRMGEAKLVPLRAGLLIAWRLVVNRLNRSTGKEGPSRWRNGAA